MTGPAVAVAAAVVVVVVADLARRRPAWQPLSSFPATAWQWCERWRYDVSRQGFCATVRCCGGPQASEKGSSAAAVVVGEPVSCWSVERGNRNLGDWVDDTSRRQGDAAVDRWSVVVQSRGSTAR